jgi:predicted DNA-binding transcriptional regulator AlpA
LTNVRNLPINQFWGVQTMSTEQKWVNVKELAQYLKCSESFIYHKVCERAIPFSKKSGLKFFLPHIDKWMCESGDYFTPENYTTH